jgi:hypothetical protein
MPYSLEILLGCQGEALHGAHTPRDLSNKLTVEVVTGEASAFVRVGLG